VKKVHITSDGTGRGTRIVDLETGKEMRDVKRLAIRLDAGEDIAFAEITILSIAKIDVLAERIK
jgi:hypothetical protein